MKFKISSSSNKNLKYLVVILVFYRTSSVLNFTNRKEELDKIVLEIRLQSS